VDGKLSFIHLVTVNLKPSPCSSKPTSRHLDLSLALRFVVQPSLCVAFLFLCTNLRAIIRGRYHKLILILSICNARLNDSNSCSSKRRVEGGLKGLERGRSKTKSALRLRRVDAEDAGVVMGQEEGSSRMKTDTGCVGGGVVIRPLAISSLHEERGRNEESAEADRERPEDAEG